jgi:hypothetical protein
MSDAYKQAVSRIESAENIPASVAAALLAALAVDGGVHVEPDLRQELEATVYRLASLPDPSAASTQAVERLLRDIAKYEQRKWLARLA